MKLNKIKKYIYINKIFYSLKIIMKPLEKEIKQKNAKNLYEKINSESLKVTTEDNYDQISEKKPSKEKKSIKRKNQKIPVIEEKDNTKESKSLFCSNIKTFLKKYKLLLILSLILIIILAVILIYFMTKKNTKKVNRDIPSKSSGDYIPSEPEPEKEPKPDAESNTESEPINNFEPSVDDRETNYEPVTKIEKEFEILTKVGDLKSISVIQKVKEETKLNSEIIKSEIMSLLYLFYYIKMYNISLNVSIYILIKL